MRKHLYLLFSLFVSLYTQEVSFNANVDKLEINDNEIFKLYLEFSWYGNLTDFKVSVNKLPDLYGLKMLGSGSSNKITTTPQGQLCQYKVIYNLKATRTGDVSIEGISGQVVKQSDETEFILSANPITLGVTKYKEPFSFTEKTWIIGVAVTLVVLSILIIVLLYSKRKKQKFSELNSNKYVVVENDFLEILNRLRVDIQVEKSQLDTFIDAFDRYFSEKKLELTSVDVSFDPMRFKEKIDMYRFSGQVPDIYEFEQLIIDFKEILNKNLSVK